MDRIASPTGRFEDPSPIDESDGTPITAAWLNHVQEEVAGVIEAAGLVLNPARTDQLQQAVKAIAGADAVQASLAAAVAVAARDAALIQPGVYASIAAGLAGTAVGQFFKVVGGAGVAASEYEHRVSPNLFNPTAIRAGYYLRSSDGAILASAGWGCSGFIPVTPGKQYTLSGTRSRVGIAYFSAAADGAVIVGSYSGSAGMPLTTTAPAGATHVAFNLYTATAGAYSAIQFEDAASASVYTPYAQAIAVLRAQYPDSASIAAVGAQVSSVQQTLDTLPVDYLPNLLTNGNLAQPATWVAEAGEVVSVAAVAELAALGLVGAYALAPEGGQPARIRLYDAAELGVAPGDYILAGLFVYASDGVSFPSSFASFGVYIDGVISAMDSTGYVQVSPCVRFMYGKKLIPSGAVTQIILGFSASGVASSVATRYVSGFYLHRSAAEIAVPSDPIRLTGWDGQPSRRDFFASLSKVEQASSGRPRLVLAGAGESYVEVVREGVTIRRCMRIWPEPSLTGPCVVNPTTDMVDGLAIRVMGEDAAPYRAMGTTIGANHGYAMYSVSCTNHGKTAADVGAVYASAGDEYVLVGINGVNAVWLTRRADNGMVPADTFTHVSGGVNTASLVGTASVFAQMYPPTSGREVRVFVDGVRVESAVAELSYARDVQIVETYDVLEKSTMVEWMVAHGSAGPVPAGTAAPAFSVSITYAYDIEGQCTIYSDFLARKAIALQDLMFVMGVRMAAVDGEVRYYIPKALPLEHEGRSYDYARIDSADTAAWAGRLNLTPARCEPAGILADRVVQLSDRYGFALGYLPEQDAWPAARRTNATVKALQISNSSGKVYLSAIDKGAQTLAAGDCFSVIAYRNIVLRSAARTSHYAVRTNGADYLYVDWHTSGVDRVPIPPDFVGRGFEVVEKSANVTLLSKALSSTVLVDVAATGGYGYLIVKVL